MNNFTLESKWDWLTLTLKPENDSVTLDDLVKVLSERMILRDLLEKMVYSGRFAFYEQCLSYENISLCLPKEERAAEQGVCIRISSRGLDFFKRYLDTYNMTLKQWLGGWRALCFEGYISKDTRIDYALDDIHYNGDKPLLTMKKIINCLRKGEIRKKARVANLFDGSTSLKECYKTANGEPVIGRTVYLGARKSDVSCRFYDKLAEQIQKKQPIDDHLTSWVRCEFELKGSAAMSVLNAFLDMPEADFAHYMRGFINDKLSFIVRNDSNISRCPVKRWWSKFLGGCTEKFRLPHKAPARSAFARASRGFCQYLGFVNTMISVLGESGFIEYIKRCTEQKISKNPDCQLFKPEIANNLNDGRFDYENMTGYKYYSYNSGGRYPRINYKGIGSDFRVIRLRELAFNIPPQKVAELYLYGYNPYKGWLRRPIECFSALVENHSFSWKFYRAHRLSGYELQRHLDFMDGQEVLTC